MDSFYTLVLIIGILCTISIIYALLYSKNWTTFNPFLDKKLLERGMDKPIIWLFYDASDTNQREWYDFGARSSRAFNIPFLNLCYESIVHHNKNEYRVEVISGLSGMAELLGGWDQLPPGLRTSISPINEAELNWIRTAILARFGGLWLSPHTICLRPFGLLPNKIVFFGTDLDETLSGKYGTTVPGFRAVWSPKPMHPMFKEWAMTCYKRVAEKRGGDQIRGDVKWDFVRFSTAYSDGIVIDPHSEGLRKQNGKRIQLEDLLASGTDGNLPFDVSTAIYIPIPWTELRDRTAFGWFLKMSEQQIMESDLAIKYLCK